MPQGRRHRRGPNGVLHRAYIASQSARRRTPPHAAARRHRTPPHAINTPLEESEDRKGRPVSKRATEESFKFTLRLFFFIYYHCHSGKVVWLVSVCPFAVGGLPPMPYNLILECPINVDPISLLFFFIQLCGASGLRHRRPFLVKVIDTKYSYSCILYMYYMINDYTLFSIDSQFQCFKFNTLRGKLENTVKPV